MEGLEDPQKAMNTTRRSSRYRGNFEGLLGIECPQKIMWAMRRSSKYRKPFDDLFDKEGLLGLEDYI